MPYCVCLSPWLMPQKATASHDCELATHRIRTQIIGSMWSRFDVLHRGLISAPPFLACRPAPIICSCSRVRSRTWWVIGDDELSRRWKLITPLKGRFFCRRCGRRGNPYGLFLQLTTWYRNDTQTSYGTWRLSFLGTFSWLAIRTNPPSVHYSTVTQSLLVCRCMPFACGRWSFLLFPIKSRECWLGVILITLCYSGLPGSHFAAVFQALWIMAYGDPVKPHFLLKLPFPFWIMWPMEYLHSCSTAGQRKINNWCRIKYSCKVWINSGIKESRSW